MMKKCFACLLCIMFLAGCGSYYKITDPSSKKIYYTEDIDQMDSGAVKFKDAKTDSQVTLQSSEVKEIDSKEFEESTKSLQPVKNN